MSDAVVYEQFDQTDGEPHTGEQPPGAAGDLRRLSEVPLELSVEIGRTGMTVGETLDLRAGSIVTLDRLAGEPVDLLVNGTPIARGEVVVVDEQFGMRVTEILEGDPSAEGDPGGGGDAASTSGPPASTAASPEQDDFAARGAAEEENTEAGEQA